MYFFKQKTAYEMRISDWSSDVCSSDLEDVDLADLRFRPFADLEHHIDAVLVELNHLGIDARGEATLALVEFDDARDVGPHLGPGENLARRELDLGPDLVFLEQIGRAHV